MSDGTVSSALIVPAMWAILRRVDPPSPKEDDSSSTSDLPVPVNKTYEDDKTLQHIVTSPAFTGGNNFAINSDMFTIGRANQCNLVLRYNKLISGKHCCIYKDEEGTAWLEDTSTNGTLLNKTKKLVKEKVKLKHGDVVHLVYKNCTTADNLGFIFERNDGAEEDTQQYENEVLPDLSETLEKSIDHVNITENRKHRLEEEESSIAKKKIHLDSDPEVDDTDDEMGETLICIICQDILYDCVSLQPCMHSFCAGCYSEWMATSNECPCCRLKVDRISKNHLVNNLVESYLKKNQNKKRSNDDIRELESKNKITYDMLYKNPSENDSGSSSSSPCSGSGLSSGSSSLTPVMPTFMNFNPVFTRNVTTFGPPRTICRQCPQNSVGTTTDASCAAACAMLDSEDMNSDSACAPATSTATTHDAKTTPQAPDRVCTPDQNHVLCMCCLQPMPDRRQDRHRDDSIPKQQCSICYRSFCHAYWTCPKADCLGCLGKFREMNFGRKCLASILLENQFESDVLRDYLDSKDISVRQMLDTCIVKLEASEYSTTDSNRGALNADTFICYPCGLRNFRELAYSYRKDIDEAELPAAVTSREKCYWGNGCRTQKHKPAHAIKLDHICEATRTRP